jgi:hypothetical protein
VDYGATSEKKEGGAKEPKPQQGEEVTYTRIWGKTMFSYRISMRKRVVELLGTSSWDQHESFIQDNAEKNKLAMQ